MKTKIEKLKNSQNLLKIEVEKEKIDSKFDEVYKEFQKGAHIAGFRVGKAPLDLIKQYYKDKTQEEVLKRLLYEYYIEAIRESEISTIGSPEISDINFKEHFPLSFTAKVDVKPQVKISNYKGFRLTKKNAEATDDAIDLQIKQLQERFAEFVAPSDQNRAVIEGDYILVDFECSVGEEIIEKKQNAWLLAQQDSSNPDYLKELVGKKPNETAEISAKLPQDSPNKKFANQNATYKILIKDIKEKKLPQINDDFAKTSGNFKTLDELKEQLRTNLKRTNEYLAKVDLERQIDKLLIENSSFEAPHNLVENRLKELLNEAQQELERRGLKKEDIDKEKGALKERLRQEAERQIKLHFILEKIAQLEKIDVSQNEIDEAIETLAKRRNTDKDTLEKEFVEKGLIDSIYLNLKDAKIMEFLIKEAEITDLKK